MVEIIYGAGSEVLETPGPSCRDLTSDFAKTCQMFALYNLFDILGLMYLSKLGSRPTRDLGISLCILCCVLVKISG